MYQRITKWSSQGYIFLLGKVQEEKLKPTAPSSSCDSRDNYDLARIVLMMSDQGRMASFIMEPCGRPQWRSERLDNLVATFRSAMHSARHQDMYNSNTCIEFHRLLVATLLSYGKALSTLHTALDGRREACKRVWFCGGLLKEIASSLMLRQHLKACVEWLDIPVNNMRNLESYQNYTGFPHHGCRDPNDDDPGRANDPEMSVDGSEDLDMVFLKWIRLQVIHRLSLDTISRTIGSPSNPTVHAPAEPPSITLLAVPYPIVPLPMEPWETTLQNLLNKYPGRAYSHEDVRDHIKKCVSPPYKSNQHAVFKKWRGAAHGHAINFTATGHCEVLLASLAKYSHDVSFEQIQGNPGLINVLQVMSDCCHLMLNNLTEMQNINQNVLAVSKRCCPVCWTLLAILEGLNDRFGVRGRHPTVCAVDLPPWLPLEALSQMVACFEEILKHQIFTMMMQKKKHHRRTSSGQSDSATSTGSHKDGDRVDGADWNEYDG